MGRMQVVALVVLIVCLAAYVLWPAGPAADPWHRVVSGPMPERWTLLLDGLEQEVDGASLRVHGHVRPVDEARTSGLWQVLSGLVTSNEPRRGVAAGDLQAYGIGERPRLRAEGLDLRWGRRQDRLWVYDALGDRLFDFDTVQAERLVQAAGRLDPETLLPRELDLRRLVVDGLELRREGRAWYEDRPLSQRPAFSGRVATLWRLLRRLPAPDLTAAAEDAEMTTRHRLRLEWQGGRAELLLQGDEGALRQARLDDVPAVPLTRRTAGELAELLPRFSRDWLFDEQARPGSAWPHTVIVWRGRDELLALERDGDEDIERGRSAWTVRWSGGQEPAAFDVGHRFVQALHGVEVADPLRRTEAVPLQLSDDPQVLSIELIDGLSSERRWLQIAGDRVANASYQARAVEVPRLLREPAVSDLLDPMLLPVAAGRVIKIQTARIAAGRLDGSIAERSDDGWRRRLVSGDPHAPDIASAGVVEGLAIERLVGAVVTAVADEVRMAAPDDLALLQAPDRLELAVRVEPAPTLTSFGLELVEDTVRFDWGLVVVRADDRSYSAIERSGDRVFRLAAELVDGIFAPPRDDIALPVVASQVIGASIERRGAPIIHLRPGAEGWRLRLDDEEDEHPADEAAVRAWLLDLTSLRVRRSVRAAAPLEETDPTLAGLLRLQVPGSGLQRNTIRLLLGPEEEDGLLASVRVGRMPRGSAAPPGRIWIDPAMIGRLLPGVEGLLSPEALRALTTGEAP